MWVFGVPYGTNADTLHYLSVRLEAMFPAMPHVLSFPFPLDVIDKRTVRQIEVASWT
jgi:hypothetical protein